MSESEQKPKVGVWVVLRFDVEVARRYGGITQGDGMVEGLDKMVDFGDEGVITAPMDLLEACLTVKEILPSETEATAEVKRLNRLQRDRGTESDVRYVALPGRWFPEGRDVQLGY